MPNMMQNMMPVNNGQGINMNGGSIPPNVNIAPIIKIVNGPDNSRGTNENDDTENGNKCFRQGR
jgi:hypothetical protein